MSDHAADEPSQCAALTAAHNAAHRRADSSTVCASLCAAYQCTLGPAVHSADLGPIRTTECGAHILAVISAHEHPHCATDATTDYCSYYTALLPALSTASDFS